MHSTLDLSELDSKIGRLFMTGIPGPVLDTDTETLLRDYSLGGVILFSRNIENPVQLARLCNDLQESAMKYHGIPLFLSVDQEGGPVARLKEPFTLFQGNTAIGEDPLPEEKAVEFARITAKEMSLVGLNMDLAPVMDVRSGKPERHLEGRMFGDSPEKVAMLGSRVVKVLQEKGVMAVAKHFPGLGRALSDPHSNLPTIDIDLEEIEKINIPPFSSAITSRVAAIMTSHAVYPALDDGTPATLSKKIITGLLRETLHFNGLVITDDLEMGAIENYCGVSEGARAAFKAGADILLICKEQSRVVEGIQRVRESLLSGEIPFHRLQQSLDRIQKTKKRFLDKRKDVSSEEVKAYFSRKT